jgi:hypothetical protein
MAQMPHIKQRYSGTCELFLKRPEFQRRDLATLLTTFWVCGRGGNWRGSFYARCGCSVGAGVLYEILAAEVRWLLRAPFTLEDLGSGPLGRKAAGGSYH